MWRSLIDKFNRKDRKRGYTMTELLAVLGIIAVVVAIAIPSIYVISRTLKFKQRNDYAKTIFMAAQANLSEMRSDGSLDKLQSGSDAEAVPLGHCGFPAEEWSYEYVFTSSEFAEPAADVRSSYNLVLPANSVEGTLRSGNVIIEYNPVTGNVYSVFYCDEEILSQYRDAGTLPRDKDERKKMMLGYYDGSGLSSSELDLEITTAKLEFDPEGEEGILTVKIPVPESYYAHLNEFMDGLTVKLTLIGDTSRNMIAPIYVDMSNGKVDVDGRTVKQEFLLDSLADLSSFANLVAAPTAGPNGEVVDNTGKHITDYMDESEFTLLPGENITVHVAVEFEGEREVEVKGASLPGINPMFQELTDNGAGDGQGYVVYVSNGRHLQNLNAMAPQIANNVYTLVFGDDIYWNQTVEYYNNKYGAGSVYENNEAENPCRALPYFVPIHNENLFGTATFEYPDSNRTGIWNWIDGLIEDIFGGASGITVAFKGNVDVPTLTDALDGNKPDGSTKTIAQNHAEIQGEGHKVYYLNIDSTRYKVPNVGERAVNENNVEVKLDGTFYATGTRQIIDYYFTGLFGYVNTYVENLHVVNPIIKGKDFVDGSKEVPIWGFQWRGFLPIYTITGYRTATVYSNPATGALIGAAGYNTVLTNCSVYIDTQDPDFNRSYMRHRDYAPSAAQDWYGVSGAGAVGGLVGYAKSHRTTQEDLNAESNHLAFRDCFSAVNVSGKMRGNKDKHYGYSNGVGGLIGNSQLTNFFNCYSSGDVKASGLYVYEYEDGNWLETLVNWFAGIFGTTLDLPCNGRVSIGAGGFVGTSHGTRYSKCFATGSVAGTGTVGGAGGFVGVMSLDENFSYGNDSGDTSIAQTTHLTECYAVGQTTFNGNNAEYFSGANARVNFSTSQTNTYITHDYYRLYAPTYVNKGRAPNYEDTYIFRDSYYLNDDQDVSQEYSNSCATAELYNTFKDLVAAHESDDAWKTSRINDIKGISVRTGLISKSTYQKQYFEKAKNWIPNLDEIYQGLYSEGYQEGWGPATEQTTHSYSLNAAGARYPFTKLENLDYYGDWPDSPSTVGLAYYEIYLDENNQETDKRYYYDRDSTSELSEEENAVVVSDGYAIMTATQGTVKVKVGNGDKIYELKGTKQGNKYVSDDSYYPGNAAYHVYVLTDEIMDAAMAESQKGEFYVKLTITDPKNVEYVTYFNPAIALTQVNPVEGNAATKPSTIPTQLYIRSARQFAALGKNQHLWGEEFNYVQQFDIDAGVYKWTDAADAVLTSIGTATQPFKGTYRGNGGYVEQAQISGFESKVGFFDTVGSTAEIRNLVINAKNVDIDAGTAENAGILAYVNGGTIDNVDLNITGTATVAAKTNAGLLIGSNAASTKEETIHYPAAVSNCDVHAETVSVNATNAGGLIGKAAGASLDNLTVITGNNVEITKLTSAGGQVGGMVGEADMAKFQNSGVTTVLTANNALYAGGFAGMCYDSEVLTLVVNLSGASTAQDNLAGLVGAAYTSDFTAADVQLAANASMTADVVAGAFGEATQVNVKNSGIFLPGALNGTTGAAGFAYKIGKDSVVQLANVTLTNGSVTAANGKAAGYAVEMAGTVANSAVKLGTAQSGAVSIHGKTEAVGFAGTVSGDISTCSVTGRGSINASNGSASGFAGAVSGTIGTSYATPANGNTDYAGNSNSNLTVTGQATAGFALSLEREAAISGCYTLCKLTNSVGGFAGVNKGSIGESTANVTQTGGASFVGDNSGKVNNCYGWYGNGDPANEAPAFGTNTGRVTSSYFADLDDPEGLTELYDYKGEYSKVVPSTITVDHLNTATYHGWVLEEDDTYASFPYKANLKPGYYPYPRLNNHYGNWLREPQFAYGVIYYEKYADDTWAFHVVDLSDPEETLETKTLSGYYPALKGNSVAIKETGYALFYNAEKCPFNANVLDTAAFAKENLFAEVLGSRYVVSGLTADGPVEFKSELVTADGDKIVKVVPYFADAIDVNEYQVRTPEQLSHVGQYSNKTFYQTHTIQTDKLEKIDNFSGSYTAKNDSKLIAGSAPNGWMGSVTGTVALNELTVNQVAAPIFGNISNNVKVSKLTVQEASSMLVSKITSGTVDLTKVSMGNTTLDTMVGEITGGKTTMGTVTVSGDVTGSLIGKISGGETTVNTANVGGAAKGSLFGEISGSSKTTMGTVTVSGDVTGSLIGKISGGETNVNTANVGGTAKGNLFGEIGGGTNDMTTVTVKGAVEGSLVSKISGGTTTVDNVTVGSAAKGTLVGETTGGTTTLTKVTVGGETVSTLFGKITGKNTVLTGSSISISGAINGNLFTSVANEATLSGFAVTAKSADNSMIGAVSANVSNLTLELNEAVLSKGAMFGELSKPAAVSGCTVEIPTIVVSNQADTFGVIVSAVPADVTLANTTVKTNVITVNDLTATIGGLAGTNAGTISGGKVQNVKGDAAVTMTLGSESLAEDRSLVVGGLVGHNTGVIQNKASANVTIGYNQMVVKPSAEEEETEAVELLNEEDETEAVEQMSEDEIEAQAQTALETVTIGGLVGVNGGTINDASAGGSITTNASASGKTFIIGGAVGKDDIKTVNSTIEYQNVSSGVTVDASLATMDQITAACPSGKGSVGMFVGYVNSGSFQDCSSTAENTTYQFLGEIKVVTKTLPNATQNFYWFSHKTSNTDTTKDATASGQLNTIANANGYTARENGYAYNSFDATLSDCTYKNGVGTAAETYIQQFKVTEYFHQGNETTTPGGKQPTQVNPTKQDYTGPVTVKYSELANSDTSYKLTTYYYKDSSGDFKQVYVTRSSNWWTAPYTYKLYTSSGSNRYTQIGNTNGYSTTDTSANFNGVDLYKKETSWLIETGVDYLITDTAKTYAFVGTAAAVKLEMNADGNFTNDNLVTWKVQADGSWYNGSAYMNLSNSTPATSSTTKKITIGQHSISGYTLSGTSSNSTRYLKLSGQTFSTDTNSSNATGLLFWKLETVEDSYKCEFTYKGLMNQTCVAVEKTN